MMLGIKLCPRDERGWRIPRPNTKARQVYDLMVQGVAVRRIAEMLNDSLSNVEVAACRIRNPDRTNAQRLIWLRKPKKLTEDSLFVPLKPTTRSDGDRA